MKLSRKQKEKLRRDFFRALGPNTDVFKQMLEMTNDLFPSVYAETYMALDNEALATGFYDQSHLTHVFSVLKGMTPARYRMTAKEKSPA